MSRRDDDGPRRDELRARLRDVAPHRSRRDTRRWCRGRVGVEHEPVVELDAVGRRLAATDRPTCRSAPWGLDGWWCHHRRRCARCGRVLRHSLDRDCPDRPTEEDES